MNSPKHPTFEFEQLFKAFLDYSPAVAWMKDSEGRHVYLNEPYIEKIGIPSNDWFGKTDFELWPDDVAKRFVQDDQHILATNSILRFQDEENFSSGDGSPRNWWVIKFPIQDVNGRKFVGGMAIDNTDQKRAEDERHFLSREMAGIASREQQKIGQDLHDGIGQELTALDLFASSLKEKLELSSFKDQVDSSEFEMIKELATKISTGLNQANFRIRAVARGLMPVALHADNLVPALEELCKLSDEIQNINCEFRTNVSPENSALKIGSIENPELPDQLYRIAQEAVNNAIKHSSAGMINVMFEDLPEQITLRIWDNGSGIEEKKANASKNKTQGLGLRIMKYRAELINAKLTVTSDHDGTSVNCILKVNTK